MIYIFNYNLKKILYILIFIVIVSILFTVSTQAASDINNSFGIAHYLPISDKNVADGSIVSISKSNFALSKVEYDPMMVGVVSKSPAVVINIDSINEYPVISDGHAYVRVSTVNGNIKQGDLITSSSNAGVGMKATKSGYVIGTASQDFTSSNTKEVGMIDVIINIHYFNFESKISTGLLNVLNLTAIATYEQPTVVFRYFLAGILILLSFAIGLFSFGRIANAGIEALGRNPMAGRMIQVGIIFNVLITLAIIMSGVLIAYFVLRL